MTLHRVFNEYDPRQPLAYDLCQFSIVKRSRPPVAASPLMTGQLPITRSGLTTFGFSPFLVPWFRDCREMNGIEPWANIVGKSAHTAEVVYVDA